MDSEAEEAVAFEAAAGEAAVPLRELRAVDVLRLDAEVALEPGPRHEGRRRGDDLRTQLTIRILQIIADFCRFLVGSFSAGSTLISATKY